MNVLAELREILARLNIHVNLDEFLTVFTLSMARIGAAVPFVPFLGGQSVPGNVALGLTFTVSIVLFPFLSAQMHGPAPGLNAYLGLLVKELLIGSLIGILVQIVFAAVEAAGGLMEFSAGLKPQEILAPQSPTATGPLSLLLGNAAIVVYLAAGLHLILIRSLADSYNVIPLFTVPAFRPGFLPLAEFTGRVTAGFISVAFELCAPVILLLTLIKIGTALIFRVAFAGVRDDPFQPFGALAAFGMLFLAASFYSEEIVRIGGGYISQLQQVMIGLR
jgi:flagellar biosynthetic protein FliR